MTVREISHKVLSNISFEYIETTLGVCTEYCAKLRQITNGHSISNLLWQQ